MWYFRVRFLNQSDDVTVYGPYCDVVPCLLAAAPQSPEPAEPYPAVVAQEPTTTAGASLSLARKDWWVKLSWNYTNTDGTTQRYAEIREVTVAWDSDLGENVITQVAIRAKVYTQHHLWFMPQKWGWSAGTNGKTYYVQIRVTSTAGLQSDWSAPIAITIAKPVSCSIANYGTTQEGTAMYYDTVNGKQRLRLHWLPLWVKIDGAGAGDTTKLVIERAYDYSIVRPDESTFHGCEGETIVQMSHTGAAGFLINRDDLIGTLDDYAWYRVIATVEDDCGQSKTVRQTFQVRWNHQPVVPNGTVTMDGDTALIAPTAPSGANVQEGDVVDIYRISADRPQLIVQGGTFGETYRDPYPAIGVMGGHRIVYRSKYGDYFTAASKVAWKDLRRADGDYFESNEAIIDFDRYSVRFNYNLDTASQWSKDFQETTYLGGAVQGDWNPAVKRRTTVNTITIPMFDYTQLRNMRRLATFPGICHVRTPDGSSFAADVQVQESRSHARGGVVAEFTLTITRVDPQELDGELVEEE